MSMPQQLLDAIGALYGDRGVLVGNAASQWLNTFAESSSALQHSLEILTPEQPTHVQFFAANMVLATAKRHWGQINAGDQQQLAKKIRHTVESQLVEPKLSWMAIQRLISAQAFIAANSGAQGVEVIMHDIDQYTSKGALEMALTLAGSTAEACMSLHRLQRAKTVSAAVRHTDGVLATALYAIESSEWKRAAVECLVQWMKLDETETSDALMSPAEFLKRQPVLLSKVLELVMHPEQAIADAATTFVASLYGSYKESGEKKAEREAVQSTAEGVLQLRRASQQPDIEAYHNWARICNSLADRDPDAAAGAIPQAVLLAELMVDTLSCGHPGAVECAIDYFESLNCTPVAARNEQLGQPLFARILPRLTHLASFPEAFSSWQDCVEIEQDTFNDFRENVIQAGLETCQDMLREKYLGYLRHTLPEATSWQQIEAILFAARLAGNSVRLNEDSKLESINEILALTAPAAASNDFMLIMLTECIAAFAYSFASAPTEVVDTALRTLVLGLGRATCCEAAASALAAFARSCTEATARSLLPAIQPIILQTLLRGQDVSWTSKEQLLECIWQLKENASLSSHEAGQLAVSIGKPLVDHALTLISQAGGDVGKTSLLQEEAAGVLGLVATFLHKQADCQSELPSEQQSPSFVLMTSVWPQLESIVEYATKSANTRITSAVCNILSEFLQSSGPSGGAALQSAIPMLEKMFGTCPQSCLEVVQSALQMCDNWPASLPLLGHVLNGLSGPLVALLQVPQADVDIAAAAYAVLTECFDSAGSQKRDTLQASIRPILPAVCQQGIAHLSRQEEGMVKPCLAFLEACLTAVTEETAAVMHAWMGEHGGRLVAALLRAACYTLPTKLMRPLGILLLLLLHSPRFESAKQWVQDSFAQDPDLGKVLSVELREQICRLMLQMKPSMRGQFCCLVTDMAAIARLQSGPEVLLAYEL